MLKEIIKIRFWWSDRATYSVNCQLNDIHAVHFNSRQANYNLKL